LAKLLRINPHDGFLERSSRKNPDEKHRTDHQELDQRFTPSPHDQRTDGALFRQ
jgi:hypothetical protein